MGGLPVPWLPRLPVCLRKGPAQRGVSNLQWLWHTGPHWTAAVHSKSPALGSTFPVITSKILNKSSRIYLPLLPLSWCLAVCVHVCVCTCVDAPPCAHQCEGQRTACGSWFGSLLCMFWAWTWAWWAGCIYLVGLKTVFMQNDDVLGIEGWCKVVKWSLKNLLKMMLWFVFSFCSQLSNSAKWGFVSGEKMASSGTPWMTASEHIVLETWLCAQLWIKGHLWLLALGLD